MPLLAAANVIGEIKQGQGWAGRRKVWGSAWRVAAVQLRRHRHILVDVWASAAREYERKHLGLPFP